MLKLLLYFLVAVSFILRLGNFESEHLLKDFEGIAQNLEIDNKCKAQQISFYCHYLLGKSWMSLKNLQVRTTIFSILVDKTGSVEQSN